MKCVRCSTEGPLSSTLAGHTVYTCSQCALTWRDPFPIEQGAPQEWRNFGTQLNAAGQALKHNIIDMAIAMLDWLDRKVPRP